VDWVYTRDDTPVRPVLGLLDVLANGSLYFPPFRDELFRDEVHDVRVRCRASNSGGTVVSREIHVNAGWLLKYFVKYSGVIE